MRGDEQSHYIVGSHTNNNILVIDMSKNNRSKKNRNAERGNETMKVPAGGSVIITRGPRMNQPRITTVDTQVGRKFIVRNTELLHGTSTAALGIVSTTRIAIATNQSGWLNFVSSAFSKYRWIHVKLIYIPIVPSTTTGQVVLGFGYDFTDNAVTTIENAQRAYNSVTTPVWGGFDGVNSMNKYSKTRGSGEVSLLLDVNRLGSGNGPTYYRYVGVSNFTLLSNPDKNFYAPAYVNVTTGGGLAQAVGNLFIEYEVELIEPIDPNSNL